MAERAEHTPGPWHVTGADPNGGMVFAEDNTPVAAWPTHTDSGVQMANARLIAAAPDLLAALKQIAGETATWPGGDWKEVAFWMRDRAANAINAASPTPGNSP